jgi:hypothetical protein
VEFIPNQTVTFSQLTDLNAIFTSNSGGVGGGSPRLEVDFVGGTQWLLALYGPAGTFVGNDATLNAQSGFNFIGNNDVGRYDLSNAGGSGYTTYSAALALVGNLQVADVALISDTFGSFPNRDLTLDSINMSVASVVPEPTTMIAGAMLLLPFGASTLRILRKSRAA